MVLWVLLQHRLQRERMRTGEELRLLLRYGKLLLRLLL